MAHEHTYDNAQRGLGIVVPFGGYGEQYALVHSRARDGVLRVCKWRVRSRSWTKPTRISRSEFLRVARLGEFKPDTISAEIWNRTS